MPKITGITGVILAGGRSSRFGSDKTLAPWRGKTLIQHVAVILDGLFHSCLIITNNPTAHHFLGLPMTGDIFPAAGPLAGIHAALQVIDNDRACIVAGDMPLLSPALLRHLCDLSADELWDAVIPWPESGPEPLCGVYRKRVLPIIEENLQQGKRKVVETIEQLTVRRVAHDEILAAGVDPASFANVNRPEDLEEILRNQR